MSIRKTLASIASYALVGAVAVGGTLAYLSDRSTSTSAFSIGDVEIELVETFDQGAQLLPGVNVQKEVAIKNTGKNNAWVWYTYAVPTDSVGLIDINLPKGSDWTTSSKTATQEIEKEKCTVYTVCYNKMLEPGKTTPVGMESVSLDSSIDYNKNDGKFYKVVQGTPTPVSEDVDFTDYKVYVAAYAIQADQNIDTIDEAYDAFVKQWSANPDNPTLPPMEYESSVTAVNTAEELKAGLEAGGEVVLTADIVVNSTLGIKSGTSSTLDLNGCDLSYAVDNDGKASAIINNAGTLDITGEGTISFVAADPDMKDIPSYATNTISNTGTLTIGEGVTVINESAGGASFAVDNHGTFTLNGGTLKATRTALRIAKYNSPEVNFTMNGGSLIGSTPAWIQLPGSKITDVPKITVIINDGVMQTTKESSADNNIFYTYTYGNSHANTSVTINGGEFLGGTVSIGSCTEKFGYADYPTLNVTGGTFEYDVVKFNADGYEVLYDVN